MANTRRNFMWLFGGIISVIKENKKSIVFRKNSGKSAVRVRRVVYGCVQNSLFVVSVGQSLTRFPGVGPTNTQPGWTKGILLVRASGIGVLMETLSIVITPYAAMTQCVSFPVGMA
jgi:hypothetical protein